VPANTPPPYYPGPQIDSGPEPERLADSPPEGPPGIRVSTMTHSSVELARRSGAWGAMAPWGAPFAHMQVWEGTGSNCIRWSAEDELGTETMGHVVENSAIRAGFLAVPRRVGAGRTMFQAKVEGVRLPRSGRPGDAGATGGLAVLSLEGGKEIHARLVVAADGANSRVRQMAGIQHSVKEYDQRGVTFTVETAEPNHAAWQKFLPTGPLAILPVRSGYSNVVWSTSPEMARELLAMSSSDLIDAVHRAMAFEDRTRSGPISGALNMLGGLVGRAAGPSQRFAEPPGVLRHVGEPAAAFPLRMVHSQTYVAPRLALIGDAAHVVHPLAGQGVNLGLGDADVLATAVGEALAEGADYGDEGWLRQKYYLPRRRANASMMAALELVQSVYAVSSEPFRSARGLGMGLLNASSAGKASVMGYAMGLDPRDIAARVPLPGGLPQLRDALLGATRRA